MFFAFQVIFKERSSLFEKEQLPMKRVGPTEHQLVKDSLYSPPQPQVAPVTFTLQESDEGNFFQSNTLNHLGLKITRYKSVS